MPTTQAQERRRSPGVLFPRRVTIPVLRTIATNLIGPSAGNVGQRRTFSALGHPCGPLHCHTWPADNRPQRVIHSEGGSC